MATPSEAGYHMPPEWAPHGGSWMAWPCRPQNWEDIFGDSADSEARDLLARLFPRRIVVPVPTLEPAKAGGGIHSVTQQRPVA
jgi:agmatine/peptidylarginine deiminase